ncbi:type III secretion inner membrane ring lipoprotein SctJ [Phyllobacterium sp. OV277]|uniref:type III secretion system inner membrane ring lipoprotein SctJ n=1 Tax=Phyllobacterium sp. OV277 TaxID=1882772 RepID=UPI0008908E51|nr:type III secretion inner membrane ring lipoprotein SctJ [Phyllobacterium sp. OV277]SDP45235.1 type III secretion protein J [Phyllobacterium sp. OV277]
MMHKFQRMVLALVAVCFLQACKSDLYTNLDQREANQIVATLLTHGISATRKSQKDGKLTVVVDEDQFAEAVTLLAENGLPKAEFATIGSVFKKEGLVASPVQERAQMIYALSEELSRTVSEIDGVLSARVHVVLADNDPLNRFAAPASASVFIRHEPSLNINALIPQIKTLVANGIAGLSYEKVSVIPVAAPQKTREVPPALEVREYMGLWLTKDSESRVFWIAAAIGALVLALLGAIGFLLWQRRVPVTYALEPADIVRNGKTQ